MVDIIIDPNVVGISKPLIKRIIRVIPDEDLNGLRAIRLTDELLAGIAHYDSDEKEVHVCAQLLDPNLRLRDGRNDERNVSEELAFCIFHEVRHHAQQKEPKWDDLTKMDSIVQITRMLERTKLYLEYEHSADSYAAEKLEKLRQTDPEVLSPYARTRSLIQTRLRGDGCSG